MNSGAMGDFKGIYYDTRCLLQHIDPYKQGEPLRLYLAEGGDPISPTDGLLPNMKLATNLPTTYIYVVPFALLPWGSAHLLWLIVTAGSFIFAAFLAWDLGAGYAPVLSGALIAFCVVNSVNLLLCGNIAGIVISLCIIAVWCFVKRRFVPAGILCLAVSLAIKPHDAGLIWLYFLLAGGIYRKRALQTLAVTAALCLPAVLWVSQVAPHWMQEQHSNLTAMSGHGALNDPGIENSSMKSASEIIDLQSVASVFRDEARIYNPASYLFCGALLIAWSVRTVRSRPSAARDWLALAAIMPLTLLVTYHRPYDSKLLLLTVPACAMLWAEGGLMGSFALLASTAAIAMTGDFPLGILLVFTKGIEPEITALFGKLLYILLFRTAPLILVAVCIFYLWVYLRRRSIPAPHLDVEAEHFH